MLLGDVLRNLEDETLAVEALAAKNDPERLKRVRSAAGLLWRDARRLCGQFGARPRQPGRR
ncbi:MAG: hypothetical protein ACLPSW_02490 [Roseiarcus sp.]